LSDVLQLIGALTILAAFVGVQLRMTRPDSYFSLILNLLGSALLAVLALQDQQWGFLLLEAVWALVSAWGLFARVAGRPAPVD
jgi:hypothetical protein